MSFVKTSYIFKLYNIVWPIWYEGLVDFTMLYDQQVASSLGSSSLEQLAAWNC